MTDMTDECVRNQNTRARHTDWTRRRFIQRGALGLAGLAGLTVGLTSNPRTVQAARPPGNRPGLELLESSPFVYISPIKNDGKESICHAEVWFAWLDDSVIITVAADRWKARALRRGLDKARIWVGAHGRWKTGLGGRNEAFRDAPNFIAHAEQVQDKATIDRLLEVYGRKYPGEIDKWRDAMHSGNADGSRIMIRYRPSAKSQ
jgi:hypothetical protein